jgi:hypothetical protein
MSLVKIIPIWQGQNKENRPIHKVQRLTRANCYLKNLKKSIFDEKKFKTGVFWQKMALKSEKI